MLTCPGAIFLGGIDHVLMRGTWRHARAGGTFDLARAPNRLSFVGRFANGETWNGVRPAEHGLTAALFGKAEPQAAFASFTSAANLASSGDALAEVLIRRFRDFGESGDTSTSAERSRMEAQLEPVTNSTICL